jgi:hypothetical protein
VRAKLRSCGVEGSTRSGTAGVGRDWERKAAVGGRLGAIRARGASERSPGLMISVRTRDGSVGRVGELYEVLPLYRA